MLRSSARSTFRLRALEPTETEVSRACQRLLDLHPRVALWWRSNTGAGYVLSPATYRRLVSAGRIQPRDAAWVRWGAGVGAPDLQGILAGGRALAVEIKKRGMRPSSEQLAWLAKATEAGALATWVDSLDGLERILQGCRNGSP